MNLLRKSILWMMLLFVIAPASGCAVLGGDYCASIQRPFEWRSDAEIDETPIRVVRYIETDAEIWRMMGCGR